MTIEHLYIAAFTVTVLPIGFGIGRKTRLTVQVAQEFLDSLHQHRWEKWGDPQELYTSTSFNSAKKYVQHRVCKECGHIDSREITKVEST
jgi:hypothetical protein